jgi:pimeloyl-ACP methyl ester carboxylesterase
MSSPSRQSTVLLPSERKLALAEFGPQDGFPVLYFHGFGGSRLEPALGLPEGGVPGVRLISVDRPGIGGSEPHRELLLTDWADDVEALVEELGLQRYSVLGYSWGGAYALAAARRPERRLFRVGLVSAFSRWAYGVGASRHVSGKFRMLGWLARNAPGVVRWTLSRQKAGIDRNPAAAVERALRSAEPCDREVLSPKREALAASAAEAVRQGTEGLLEDTLRVLRPWNFSIEFIQAQVRIFHGSMDTDVPVQMARELVRSLPNAELTVWKGQGHAALWRRLPEVLRSITPS